MTNKTTNFRVVGDIVKEYPKMLKVIIYHENYRIPLNSGQSKKRNKSKTDTDSVHRSIRRSKSVIKDIMLSNRFDVWATLTFNCRSCYPKCDNKPCTCDRSTCKRFDMFHCRRVLTTWLANTRSNTSPNLKYLAVPEYHINGAIHFHALLSGFNGRLKDSGKKTKNNQTIYNAPGFYSGFTNFVLIGERFDTVDFDTDYQKLTNYITKYITKDMPLIHGKRRYIVSNGLDRPITTVNGISKYKLQNIIKNHPPKTINHLYEIQEHQKTGILATLPQNQLF